MEKRLGTKLCRWVENLDFGSLTRRGLLEESTGAGEDRKAEGARPEEVERQTDRQTTDYGRHTDFTRFVSFYNILCNTIND